MYQYAGHPPSFLIKKSRQGLYQVHSVKAYVMLYYTVTLYPLFLLNGILYTPRQGMPLGTLIQGLKTPSSGEIVK